MSPTPRFVLFGPAHLTTLFLTFGLPTCLAWLVRRPGGERWGRPIAFAFAAAVADWMRRHPGRTGATTAC